MSSRKKDHRGTGWTACTSRATPQQAQDTHVIIRRKFGEIYGETWSQKLTISYGGSVEPQNAAAFLSQHDVGGALIGGASLRADEFLAIRPGWLYRNTSGDAIRMKAIESLTSTCRCAPRDIERSALLIHILQMPKDPRH